MTPPLLLVGSHNCASALQTRALLETSGPPQVVELGRMYLHVRVFHVNGMEGTTRRNINRTRMRLRTALDVLKRYSSV